MASPRAPEEPEKHLSEALPAPPPAGAREASLPPLQAPPSSSARPGVSAPPPFPAAATREGTKGDSPIFADTKIGTVPVKSTAATPNAAEGAQDEPEPESERDMAAVVIENSPAWLVSMVFHLVMMIVMAMMVYVNMPYRPVELNAETVYAEKLGDQLLFDAPGLPDIKTTAEDVSITPENLPPVEDPLAAPSNLTDIRPNATMAVSDIDAPQIGMALSGRQEGSSLKKGLLGRYGGDATTEAAVTRGLEWLARNQGQNGSWSLTGPYSDGAPPYNENQSAATAMALLAFQGAGHTHQTGAFKSNVARGWKWLLKQQDEEGCFFNVGLRSDRFYTQAQCAIGLCELYGMTKDSSYRPPAQRAIDYCLRSQGGDGGWRYSPKETPSDVSVTGWVVMALQSARMAGFSVPTENLRHVERFLDGVALHGGSRYPYQRGGEVKRSMTAEALLMREYLGWKRKDPRLVAGMEWITSPENLIDFEHNRDVYYWYYAAQAAHHIEGEYWKRWNAVMRQAVPQHQVPRGKEAGSWDPNRPTEDAFGRYAGRLYVTCLSIYMLEVYYRHLPIYTSVYTYDSSSPPSKPPAKIEERPAEKEPIEGVE